MLKYKIISTRLILLGLLLFSSSISSISAKEFIDVCLEEDSKELMEITSVGEEINYHLDSILPTQKNILFAKGFLNIPAEFDFLIETHTFSSLSYIKVSRYILPSLGTKEMIYPFHIFL